MKRRLYTIMCTDDGHGLYRKVRRNSSKNGPTAEEGFVVDLVGMEGSHSLQAFVTQSDHYLGQVQSATRRQRSSRRSGPNWTTDEELFLSMTTRGQTVFDSLYQIVTV